MPFLEEVSIGLVLFCPLLSLRLWKQMSMVVNADGTLTKDSWMKREHGLPQVMPWWWFICILSRCSMWTFEEGKKIVIWGKKRKKGTRLFLEPLLGSGDREWKMEGRTNDQKPGGGAQRRRVPRAVVFPGVNRTESHAGYRWSPCISPLILSVQLPPLQPPKSTLFLPFPPSFKNSTSTEGVPTRCQALL